MRSGCWLLALLALLLCGCAATSTLPTAAPTSMTMAPSVAASPSTMPTEAPTVTPSRTLTPTPTATFTATPPPTATRTPGPPPELVASYPIDGDRAVGSDRPLVLRYSRAMDCASVVASLTISPSVSGEWFWDDDVTCVFRPDSPWELGIDYALTGDQGAMALDGAPLEESVYIRYESGGLGAPIPILMYHHIKVLDDDASDGQRTWTVSPDALGEQIAYLDANGYTSLTPGDVVAYLEQGVPLPPRSVVLTFDDGYKELAGVVMPMFAETDLRPVLFIVPEYLGYGAYLNWEQLTDLVAQGCIVGAHGYDHSNLRKASDEELVHQIVDSQAILSEQLDVTIDSFCYPYGSYDDRVLELMATSGYTSGYTLNPSIYQVPGAPLELSRLLVHYGMDMDAFADLLY